MGCVADGQFFCNLIIAGTIIFGGGPVVIPLLRDYVVVPGMSPCSGTSTVELTDRLGQLSRLPSRFRHPVCLVIPKSYTLPDQPDKHSQAPTSTLQ